MEDFIKYLADILEFLVGGILIAISIAVTFALFFPQLITPTVAALLSVPDSLGLLVSLTGIGILFALGVVFEGASRSIVEWRLEHITTERLRLKPGAPDHASTAELRRWAVERREEWRGIVEADDSGYRTIATQLSRLRIERLFLLSSFIVFAAFTVKAFTVSPLAVNGYGAAALVTLVFIWLLFNLVNTRFNRFVGTIIREHARLTKPTNSPQDVE